MKAARSRTELLLDLIGWRPAACGADKALLQVVGVQGSGRPADLRARHVLQATIHTRTAKMRYRSTHPAIVMRRLECSTNRGRCSTRKVQARQARHVVCVCSAAETSSLRCFAHAQRLLGAHIRLHLCQGQRTHLLLPPPAAHQEEGAQREGHGGCEGDADDEPGPPRKLVSRGRLPCRPASTWYQHQQPGFWTLKGAATAVHDRASSTFVHALKYAHSYRVPSVLGLMSRCMRNIDSGTAFRSCANLSSIDASALS